MRPTVITLLTTAMLAFGPCALRAQETTLAFAGLQAGVGQPVEINSDQLEVSQTAATAQFTGNVTVRQGDLRLSADELIVEYAKGDKTKIDRMIATGHVLLSTPTEAAEAQQGIYSLATATLELSGSVLLTQGGSTISGNKLTVDLKSGTGRMDGRVKTILQPGGN